MSLRLVNLYILGIGPPKPAYTRIAKSYVLVAASTEKPPQPPVIYTPPDRTKVAKSAVLTAADQSNVQIRLSKSYVLVAGSTEKIPGPPTIYTPPDRIRVAKSYVLVAADRKLSGYTKLAKSYVLVAGSEGPTFEGLENYSWFFNQDGHVFYVFQIGQQGTFVYDFTTQKWSQWKTAGVPIWEAVNGIEYQGRILAVKPKSAEVLEVVPSGTSDEGSKAVSRVTTAQIKMTGRDSVPLGCLYVDASHDSAAPGLSPATMSLRISDDGGQTWKDYGPVSVPLESHNPKTIAYRSLGLIRYPGKLIQVIDSGGPTRIAGIDIIVSEKSNKDGK